MTWQPTEGAERWDIRAARELLTSSGERDWATVKDKGDGFYAAPSDQEKRVQIFQVRQGSAANLPRTRQDVKNWKDNLQRWALILTSSGQWQNIEIGRGSIIATARTPLTPRTTARISFIESQHWSVTFDEWPTCGGEIRRLTGARTGITSYYTYDAKGRLLQEHHGAKTGFKNQRTCVLRLATWYGLPDPVHIV